MCLDPVEVVDGTVMGQQILTAVQRTGQRFGAAHIIDVLRGGRTAKVTSGGHDRLEIFGVGAEGKKEEWQSLIRQMVAAGFLRLDIQGFGGLGITAKGQALLQGEEAFHYRHDAIARPARRERKTKTTAAVEDLSSADTALLGKLKDLRLRLAKDRGVPAYIIFSDRALVDMARRRPRTVGEFAEVNGVGEVKLKDFAAPFLEAIGEV